MKRAKPTKQKAKSQELLMQGLWKSYQLIREPGGRCEWPVSGMQKRHHCKCDQHLKTARGFMNNSIALNLMV